MKTIAILATTAALASTSVNAGTNKTLAPTPGIDRPNAPPPITPFPTEPNVVRNCCCCLLCWLFIAVGCCVVWCCVEESGVARVGVVRGWRGMGVAIMVHHKNKGEPSSILNYYIHTHHSLDHPCQPLCPVVSTTTGGAIGGWQKMVHQTFIAIIFKY